MALSVKVGSWMPVPSPTRKILPAGKPLTPLGRVLQQQQQQGQQQQQQQSMTSVGV
jgi:hypothetical protein